MQLRTLALASIAALAACTNDIPETAEEETAVSTAAATATRR